MERKELAPGIMCYSNVIPDHDNFLKYFETNVSKHLDELNWRDPTILKDGKETVAYENRNLDVLDISYKQSMSLIQNPTSSVELFKNIVGNKFYTSFYPMEKDYGVTYDVQAVWHDTYNVLRYGQGHFFKNHVDDHPSFSRRVSTVYYLNDDYSGGEILFPRFGVEYKPKKNDFLMFPSSYIYNHSVKMVTEGTRYAVVSWIA